MLKILTERTPAVKEWLVGPLLKKSMTRLYFTVNVFFPFIVHCLMQLDQHFPADKTDMFLASKLMPLTITFTVKYSRVMDFFSSGPTSHSLCRSWFLDHYINRIH
jgi:hypothetical protein